MPPFILHHENIITISHYERLGFHAKPVFRDIGRSFRRRPLRHLRYRFRLFGDALMPYALNLRD